MVLLINGGAAVALLSFMNNLPKDQILIHVPQLSQTRIGYSHDPAPLIVVRLVTNALR